MGRHNLEPTVILENPAPNSKCNEWWTTADHIISPWFPASTLRSLKAAHNQRFQVLSHCINGMILAQLSSINVNSFALCLLYILSSSRYLNPLFSCFPPVLSILFSFSSLHGSTDFSPWNVPAAGFWSECFDLSGVAVGQLHNFFHGVFSFPAIWRARFLLFI